MMNLMVANKNTLELNVLLQNLANDRKYIIKNTFDEKDTIEKYFKFNPDILVLDDSLSEISIEKIIDKLSAFPIDRQKCNTILTLKENTFLRLKKFSKIDSIVYKPFSNNSLYTAIDDLSKVYCTPGIDFYDIDILLAALGFNSFSNGYQYLKEAIIYCYYDEDALEKFDRTLDLISYEHNISKSQVRDAIRACLKHFNSINHTYYSKDLEILLYNDGKDITPKAFLQKIVIYLIYKKQKR